MINIVCAMYPEASLLIKHYMLKRIENSAFQIYENSDNNVRLVISGVGRIAVATAVGMICGRYQLKNNEYIINFGVAAGAGEFEKEVFLINKITDDSCNRTFYPDMLIASNLAEAEVTTVDEVITNVGEIVNKGERILIDMEATAIYQAAIHFVGPHRISFLKLVSDSGETGKFTPEAIENMISNKLTDIVAYIDSVRAINVQESDQEQRLSNEHIKLYEKVCQDMHCSTTMERELLQQFKYHSLSGNGLISKIDELYEIGSLPCKSKKEGKVCLDELKKSILQ